MTQRCKRSCPGEDRDEWEQRGRKWGARGDGGTVLMFNKIKNEIG